MEYESTSRKPTTRRHTPEEKVTVVRQLRKELGTSQGTAVRIAGQLGYGVESVRMWVARKARIVSGAWLRPTTAFGYSSLAWDSRL